MRRTSLWYGAVIGFLTSFPLLALMFAGERIAGLPYVPFVLFEWLTRVLPGGLITAGIEGMVSIISGLGVGPTSAVAKIAEMSLAVAMMLGGAAVLGAVLALLARRIAHLAVAGALAGGLVWAVTLVAMLRVGGSPAGLVASALWLFVLLVGWGAFMAYAVARAALPAEGGAPGGPARRRFLGRLAVAGIAIFAAAVGLGRALGRGVRRGVSTRGGSTARDLAGQIEATSGPAASPPPSALATRPLAVQGTRPELTETSRFYRIDINLAPPRIDARSWRLRIDGLVARPQSLTLDDLRGMPAVSQVITLECISNRLGGDLISTAVFTGVRLKDLLAHVGRRPEARALFIESADGYFESVEPKDVDDDRTLLVWAMNDELLPAEHGFPLRISIANRYGMKQPKWITHIEATDETKPGYWVVRGWNREAIAQTTSVVDTVGMSMTLGQTSVLPVGGIAYAGARGISKVEVQVDGGPWVPAQLRIPPLSPLSWVQWRYDWPHQTGKHTFRVRAYDGTGALQPIEPRSPHPSGATGIHEMTVQV